MDIFKYADGENYREYFRDESRSTGEAESISFPKSEGEILEIIAAVRKKRSKLTLQGARTGITGGAVPQGGHVMNFSMMKSVTGARYEKETNSAYLTVQPGLILSQLRKMIEDFDLDTAGWSKESKQALKTMRKSGPWLFTPDPTETSASLGGMVACNASGARSFYYGPTRNYVEALRIVLPNGSTFNLKRGTEKARDGMFAISTDQGATIQGRLPSYTMPEVKNAAGYYVKEDMDLLDLFVGSEGTLGMISEIEIRLIPAPPAMWGVTAFFPDEKCALRFVSAIRNETGAKRHSCIPVAVEYFNHDALDLLRVQKQKHAAFSQIQELRPDYHTAVYVEFHADGAADFLGLIDRVGRQIAASGGREEDTWVAAKPVDMDKLLFFRHAVPESVNMLIDERRRKDPGLTKLGTDMAVPTAALEGTIAMYNRDLARKGLDSVIFGHVGDNHVHVNILPNSMDEYRTGEALYLKWTREAARLGGTVSAEHGIGKLKKPYFLEMYGEDAVRQMVALKSLFDPEGMLNSGNLF